MRLKHHSFLICILYAVVNYASAAEDCPNLFIGSEWGEGFDGFLRFEIDHSAHGWVIHLTFDQVLTSLDCWQATVSTTDSKTFTLTNLEWDSDYEDGAHVELHFQPHFTSRAYLIAADIDDQDICGGAPVTTTTLKPDTTTTSQTQTTTTSSSGQNDCDGIATIVAEDGQQTEVAVTLTPTQSIEAWVVEIVFDSDVLGVTSPLADITGSGKVWSLACKSFDCNLESGASLDVYFYVYHGGNGMPRFESISFNGVSMCGTTTPTSTPGGDCEDVLVVDDNGADSDITLFITPATSVTSWTVIIEFLSSVQEVSSPLATVTGSGAVWTLTNKSYDGGIDAGTEFELIFNVVHGDRKPEITRISFNENILCGGDSAETTTPGVPTTTTASDIYNPDHPPKYPYGEIIEKSLLFYEAQRAGPLPSDNRVPWRGNAAMEDEVLGGYFDAGDHVKFGFPMAAFTTVVAWGGINFQSGYEKAGQLEWLSKSIKWSTDYFIGCHTSDFEFIGQIGDGNADHAFWGRPEEMTMARPAFKITASAPGSELAGETAAALAASSIFFRNIGDTSYADECLTHAKKLFEFADVYRGDYTDAIPAEDFYNDWGGYLDELAWSAAWIALATGAPEDIAKAKSMYEETDMASANPGEVSWDDKSAMVFLAMYALTGEDQYKAKVEDFVETVISFERTGKGLVWIGSSEWGSLRYAANFAMYTTQAAYYGVRSKDAFDFAESQINYILGDTGRSYVVGWGVNPPQRAHHRGASCPNVPAPCDWANKDDPGPNPQILNGALVGGPDRNDNYVDDRNMFQMTEVATDYNGGFQTALAGLNTMFR